MRLFNPKQETFQSLDEHSRQIMLKTIAFFEDKGKKVLKEEDHERRWYSDFLGFLKENRIFYSLLTPTAEGGTDPNTRWDNHRNCAFNEVLAFYSLSHWYAWQVTILGLGPIWMSKNAAVKRKTAQLLKDGGIFGFGLSEKAHGADLYATEMMLTPMPDGSFRADGGKYYIGNGNEAALLSVFGKNSDTDEFVFFPVETRNENYRCIQNLCNSQMYVSEFELTGYPVKSDEVLSSGSDAWDAALNTVNVGKYNLGWASIGISTHAFYEAIKHAANRNLYGKWVTDFPHIQQLLTDAFCRLLSMRLFASRAGDYFRTASLQDRRYLLFNPLVKMKVTTQGEEVVNLLWDVIAARGYEKDTYFEKATRDIRALPKLEGTVHVNMALVVKFLANYLFNPAQFPEIPKVTEPKNDDFLFQQGPARGLGKVRFHDYNLAYDSIDQPNANILKEQIGLLKQFLMMTPPTPEQAKDIDFLLCLGELFSVVAYGQLIIENARIEHIEDDLLDQVFDFMVRDFSRHALTLYSKPSSSEKQMDFCLKMIKKPVVDVDRFKRVWEKHVYPMKDAYEMNP
ncbi:MAG: acyl-CoA dehydrogenase [Deltaproteobacteria bacterium]|nr:acyl-CoA dehydrogenase [Deltaproteobacteria bacterium]